MRAEQDHRYRRALHDQAQGLHTVHAWHFQVKSDDVRTQLLNLSQRKSSVHGRAHYFNGSIARQNGGNELAHQRGVVDHQNFYALAHAVAPRGRALANRATTAGTFRIRTTVPSPRME